MRLKSIILTPSTCFWFGLFSFTSCGLFTFSGIVLSPGVENFSVQDFSLEIAERPDLDQKLTEELATKLTRMTNLPKVDSDGHIQYEGIIKSFVWTTQHKPEDTEGSERVLENLTIVVEVSFHNEMDEDLSFYKERIAASESTEHRLQDEDKIVDKVVEKLVDDIIDKSIRDY